MRVELIENYLDNLIPNPKCELEFSKDYELLIKAKADSEKVLDNIDKYDVLKNMLKESINMD